MAQQCRVLDQELQDAYAGPCVNGFAGGAGYALGRTEYHGEFQAGMTHGRGVKAGRTAIATSASSFKTARKGEAPIRSAAGAVGRERYEGDWRADRRQGQGVYRWPTGDVYSGPWEADRPTGAPTAMMRAPARWAAEAR